MKTLDRAGAIGALVGGEIVKPVPLVSDYDPYVCIRFKDGRLEYWDKNDGTWQLSEWSLDGFLQHDEWEIAEDPEEGADNVR